MSVKSASPTMFENIRDSADCVQLSSIMGSSLLTAWEAQNVNISELNPWPLLLSLGYWRLHRGRPDRLDHACRDHQWRGRSLSQWSPPGQPHLQAKLPSLSGQNAQPRPVSEGWPVGGAGEASQYECNIRLQGEASLPGWSTPDQRWGQRFTTCCHASSLMPERHSSRQRQPPTTSIRGFGTKCLELCLYYTKKGTSDSISRISDLEWSSRCYRNGSWYFTVCRFSLGITRCCGTRTGNFTSRTQSQATGLLSTTRDWVKAQRRVRPGRCAVGTSFSSGWTWWRTVERQV